MVGFVFRDDGATAGTANDGVRQADELGLNSVTVEAHSVSCGGICRSTTSAPDGAYELWLADSLDGVSVELRQQNLPSWISTGAETANTAGVYDRSADAITYLNSSGTVYQDVNFGDVPPNRLVPSNQASAVAGGQVDYAHTYTAGSVGEVSFTLSHQTNPATPIWGSSIFQDLDCSGSIDAGEPVLTSPLALGASASVCLVVRVAVPPGAAVGSVDLLTVQATLSYSGAAPPLSDAVEQTNTTKVIDSAGALTLTKSADKSTARPGETITYTIQFANLGLEPLSKLDIFDATPAYTTFVSASCASPLPSNLTGCSITQQPAVGTTGSIRWTLTGELAPGAAGEVSFSVQVD